MGTRADFYIGRGADAEWLGSIAWDGYPSGLNTALLMAATEGQWRERVASLLANRKDATTPEDGWPWPWNDSGTTDYAYAFEAEKVHASCFGHRWFDPLKEDDDTSMEGEKIVIFPDMRNRKRVTLGPRSGVIVIGSKE